MYYIYRSTLYIFDFMLYNISKNSLLILLMPVILM